MLCEGYWGKCKSWEAEESCEEIEYKQECIMSKAGLKLREFMRILWEEHVFWTRLTIISSSAHLADLDFTIKRLLRNAIDFEMAFKPFYGEEKARIFGELMRDHIMIAAQLVKVAKVGNRKAALKAETAWYANADEIAAFLSDINPNWPEANVRTMLHHHLSLTETEIITILTGDHGRNIATFDEIESQALLMADTLSNGISTQFPDAFMR